MSNTVYRTASVEILDDAQHLHICEVCPQNAAKPPAWALYNVFDGTMPIYSCGNHLTRAIEKVATRK